jgi:hypothetical protein
MKDLAIKAVATGAGGFYYREEHEWRGLNEQASGWFAKKLGELQLRISQAGAHGGDITAEFTATVDGVAVPPLVVTGVTRHEMLRFEQEFHHVSGELIKIGLARAEEHGKKHDK